MKVPAPPIPPNISKREFKTLLKVLIAVGGNNFSITAELLEITRPTLYKWLTTPPRQRRWLGVKLRRLLVSYIDVHDHIVATSRQQWQRDASNAQLEQLIPLIMSFTLNSYTLTEEFDDGTESTERDLTAIRARTSTLHAHERPRAISEPRLTKLSIRDDRQNLIWLWRPSLKFTIPFEYVTEDPYLSDDDLDLDSDYKS
jgi:hypothetical protein